MRARIYVASRACYADRWRTFRTEHAPSVEVISTWIDQAGDGEIADFGDFWFRCIAEVQSADALIAIHHRGDDWKGAFVEIGAALSFGIPVYVVGDPPGSWVNHPLVQRTRSAPVAAYLICSNHEGALR